jgi:hypothetical protein
VREAFPEPADQILAEHARRALQLGYCPALHQLVDGTCPEGCKLPEGTADPAGNLISHPATTSSTCPAA